jgi:hypothetical protein
MAREIYRHLLRLGLLSKWNDLVSTLPTNQDQLIISIATTYVSVQYLTKLTYSA